MPAHLYAPAGGERRPAVLVLHTVAGPGPNIEAFARALAEAGYVAMTPDLLIHHGEADTNVPVGQARLLHQTLLTAGKSSTLHTYPGADHLFNFSLGPDARFHPEAARLAWERMLRSLDRHLKSP